ncbi:MAG: hypothetical protein AAGJ97_00430 [Planctomycetota bacterium]
MTEFDRAFSGTDADVVEINGRLYRPVDAAAPKSAARDPLADGLDAAARVMGPLVRFTEGVEVARAAKAQADRGLTAPATRTELADLTARARGIADEIIDGMSRFKAALPNV